MKTRQPYMIAKFEAMTLTANEAFFYAHAGHSYNPKTETPEQGRTRAAVALAAAEDVFMQACRVADVDIHWEDDPDDSSDGDVTPKRREQCYIWHRDESATVHYLASLGGIQDTGNDYRRVIRAELASECLAQLADIIKGQQ